MRISKYFEFGWHHLVRKGMYSYKEVIIIIYSSPLLWCFSVPWYSRLVFLQAFFFAKIRISRLPGRLIRRIVRIFLRGYVQHILKKISNHSKPPQTDIVRFLNVFKNLLRIFSLQQRNGG